jgi:hypothetical protein
VSGIADELRARSYRWTDEGSPIVGLLLDVADRIDAETVALPKDADGRPIRVGDTVYACDDPSLKYEVSYIEFRRGGITVGMDAPGIQTYRKPALITHERPDSLERIAGELEGVADCGDILEGEEMKLREIVGRIRRLADKEGGSDERI